jgi:hypothetical protein
MTRRAENFVDALAALSFDNVFNPYADICADHDRPNAPAIRRRNLMSMLDAAEAIGTDSIWFGRDLGYRGGRRTGLALTDEIHLAVLGKAFGDVIVERATATAPVAERTAQEIWKMIRRLPTPPFLWNAFPFHPYEPGDPMTNRCHTAREARLVEDILETLLTWFRPRRVIALGNDAQRALQRMGWDATYIRHPSYGGQAAFVAGISQAYGLAPRVEASLLL